ncbi:MAG: GAF domain-containing protein [Thiolinea sp.]
MEDIIDKLNRIGLPLSIITEEQARRMISATIRKLSSLFDQCLIRVYKVEVTEDGNILDLVANISIPNRISNAYSRISLDDVNKKGALSWCIDKKTSFWVEDIINTIDKGSLVNLVTNEKIGETYTDFSFNPDSVISVPLMTKKHIIGVLSIQIPQSRKFSTSLLSLIEDLGSELARILRKSNEHESNINNTTQAVEDFLDEIRDLEFNKEILEESYKTGFVARPFGGDFDKIGEAISKYFQEEKILARHYDTDIQGGLIITQIIKQIKESHFCIADISNNNPNVLMEVGIMIAENKPIRLIRRHDLDDQIPFNVSGYQIYKYKIQNLSGKIQIAYPGEERYRDLKKMIDYFINELNQDPSFFNSKPYEGNDT